MKKLKLILPVLLAAVMLLSIPFSAACKKKHTDNGVVTTVLQSLAIDLSEAKTEYYVNENFTSEGLKVTATVQKSDSKTPEEIVLEDNEYVIDWSSYSKRVVATYPITVSYTLGGVTKAETYNVSVKDIQLEIDTTDVQKLYVIGDADEVNKTGLVANLVTYEPDKAPVKQDVTSKVFVSWNKIDLQKEATYTVPVYYYGLNNPTAEFDVEVIQPRNGLQVKLLTGVVAGATVADDGLSASITLTSGNNSINIDKTKIEVRKSDKYGVLIDEVITLDSNYTVKVFKDKTEITNPTNLHGGVYQIWVATTIDDSDNKPYEVSAFAPVYVDDTLSSVAFKSGTTTQQVGKDEITDTWEFTATYVSGATEDFTLADVLAAGGSISVDTTVAGQNKEASVNFKSVSATGKTTVKNVKVNYTITPLTGEHDYEVTLMPNGNSVDLKWGELVGSSQHCNYSGSVSTYGVGEKSTSDGETTYSSYVQIKGTKTMTVTLGSAVKSGSATITVYVSHNSASNERTANIKNGSTVIKNEAINSQGSAEPLHILKAENLGAGTYTIDASDTMYVYAVIITYTVDYGSGT